MEFYFILCLLAPLAFAAKNCTQGGFRHCDIMIYDIDHQEHPKRGITCSADAGAKCKAREDWCKARNAQIDSPYRTCSKTSNNLKFENCLHVPFSNTIGDEEFDYIWSAVETHWEIAEKFCSGKGYNLLSLSTKAEFDFLTKTMQEALNDPEEWVQKQDGFTDNAGQRCEEDEVNKQVEFWTGLFYDGSKSTWNYTDGSNVNFTVGVDKIGQLEAAIDFITMKERARITWSPSKKFKHVLVDNKKNFIAEETRKVQILCKKSSKSTAKSWKPNKSKLCITGHDCDGKCLAGAALTADKPKTDDDNKQMKINVVFNFAELDDDDTRCEDGSDHELDNFKHVKVPAADGKRKFVFLPIYRDIDKIFKFCKKADMSPVAMKSLKDKDILLSLPAKYQEENPDDLLTVSRNMSQDPLAVPMKITKDGKWDDGSKPEADLDIKTYAVDTNLVLDEKGDISESESKAHVVCQENSAPSTSPVSGSLKLFAYELWFLLVVLVSSVAF